MGYQLRYWEKGRQRGRDRREMEYSHNFYYSICNNCSISLLIVISLLLCLIYKLYHRYRWGGTHKNPKLSFGGWAPCSTGFPHWVSVLGTHLCQCTSWCCCERLRLASVNFFWRLYQLICPFHNRWITSAPAHIALNVQQFWTQNGMTLKPHPPLFTWSLPKWLFLFPGWKKSS